MNNKIKNISKKIISIAIVGILSIFISIFYFELHIPEKEIIVGQATYPYYDIHSAIETSEYIYYGKVTEISNTKVNEYGEHYKNLTIEIIEPIKGTNNATSFSYIEMGGETDTHIYLTEGIEPLNINETYIFFLTENYTSLSPSTLLPVYNNEVSVSDNMKISTEDNLLNINTYIEQIEEIINPQT